jgi:hypothetical protein
MEPSQDHNGAMVTNYVLEIDQGEQESAFQTVSSYSQESLAMQHTVTYASDNIITGKVYTLRFKAMNSKGYSEYSENLSVAVTSPPSKAATPVVDYEHSSRTSIYVSWELNKDGHGVGSKITGYKLYMDDGIGGDF